MNTIRQLELFEDKETFDEEAFKLSCVNNRFELCIGRSIRNALDEINGYPSISKVTYRTKANFMHDLVFQNLHDTLCGEGLCTDNDFQHRQSGNDRDYFKYAGYIFLIKKGDASKNDTSVASNISRQKFGAHILEICYTIDRFWNGINRIEYRYTIEGSIMFSHTLDKTSTLNINAEQDVDRPIITLKKSVKEQTANVQ